MATVLYVTAEFVRQIAILVRPFMPTSSDRLLAQFKANVTGFDALQAGKLAPGLAIDKPQGVFPRLELKEEGA